MIFSVHVARDVTVNEFNKPRAAAVHNAQLAVSIIMNFRLDWNV